MAILNLPKGGTKASSGWDTLSQGSIPLPQGFTDFFMKAGTLEISYFLERMEQGKTKYLVPFPNQPEEVSITRIYDENIRYTFDTEFAYREISRPRQVRAVLTGQTGSANRAGMDAHGNLSYVSGAEHLKAFEKFLDEYHIDASNLQSPVTFNLVSLDNDIDYTMRPYLVFRAIDENVHGRCVIEDFSYKRSVNQNRIESYAWQLTLMIYDGVVATDPTQFEVMKHLEGASKSIDAITGVVDVIGASALAATSQIANGVNDIGTALEDLLGAVDNIDNQILGAAAAVVSVGDSVLDVLERFSNTWTDWGDEFADFFTGETTSNFINNFNRRYSQRAILQHYAEIHKKNPRLVGAWYNAAYGENGTYEGLSQSVDLPLYYVQLFPERYEYVYPDDDETQDPIGVRRIGADEADAVLEQTQQALTAPDDDPMFWYGLVELQYQMEILLGYLGNESNRRSDTGPNALTGFLLRDTGLRALGAHNTYNDLTPREKDDVRAYTISHTMRAGESLMSVANGYLGSPDLWYLLSRLNNCLDAHTFSDGRNIGVGSIIKIPMEVPAGVELSLSPNSGYSPEEQAFFMDFELSDEGDLVFDLASPNDLRTITGVDNVKQAIATRLNTVAGEITRHPKTGIGTQGLVGSIMTESQATLVLTRLREALMEDPRIVDVVDSQVSRAGDLSTLLSIELTVITLGDRSFRIQSDI